MKRPWDGRLRRVVKVLNRRKKANQGFQRERLECGHLYAHAAGDSHEHATAKGRGAVYRVCNECQS